MRLQGLFLSPAGLSLLSVFLLLSFLMSPKALFHLAVQRSSCYHLPCHLQLPLSFFLCPLFPVLPCLYPFCNPQDLLLPLLSVLLHRYLYCCGRLLLFLNPAFCVSGLSRYNHHPNTVFVFFSLARDFFYPLQRTKNQNKLIVFVC